MERGGQKPADAPSQMAEEGRNCISEKRRVIMAVTQMLDSGTLDERSSHLLEQLAGYIRCPPTETPRGPESDSGATRQPAPLAEESSEESGAEPNPDGISGKPVWGYVLRSVQSYYTTPLNSSLGASVST